MAGGEGVSEERKKGVQHLKLLSRRAVEFAPLESCTKNLQAKLSDYVSSNVCLCGRLGFGSAGLLGDEARINRSPRDARCRRLGRRRWAWLTRQLRD